MAERLPQPTDPQVAHTEQLRAARNNARRVSPRYAADDDIVERQRFCGAGHLAAQ